MQYVGQICPTEGTVSEIPADSNGVMHYGGIVGLPKGDGAVLRTNDEYVRLLWMNACAVIAALILSTERVVFQFDE